MKPIAKGECDACPKVDVDLFSMAGSTLRLCVTCYQAEVKAVEDSKWINNTLATAKVIDSSIKLKADIFNTTALSFGELQAAIQHDETVPADKKAEQLMQMVSDRIQNLNKVIFQEEEITMAKRNERASWSTQIKEFVGTLRAEQREKFKKYDINYSPAPATKATVKKAVGPQKPRKTTGFTAAEMNAIKDAASKYSVPMASIQMLAKQKNISPDAAGKEMAAILTLAKK